MIRMIPFRILWVGLFLVFAILDCKKQSHEPRLKKDSSGTREALERSVYIFQETGTRPLGTGFLIDQQGTILTCLHVVQIFKANLRVSKDAIHFYKAKIIFEESKLDLVKLESPLQLNTTQPVWANVDDLLAGDELYTIAAPWGLINSYLKGYVAHNNRVGTDIALPKVEFIQTMGLSFPGTSGSPVYNARGAIVGINRSTYGYVAGNGIGFAIPANQVKEFIQSSK